MISHKPLTDDDKKHMGQIRCDESDCVCVCFRMKVRMTATSQTMAMRRTGGRTRWLSPASCWSERSLNSGAVSTKTHGSDDSLSPAVMQCVQSDWRCETQQIFDHRTVGAFPLPFKLRKLKLRIESIHKNAHISRKRFYARMRWFFRQCKNFFFCIYRSHGVCKMSYMIILQCTITSKKHLIVALKYKGLCLLFNLHCTQAAQCGSYTATRVDLSHSSLCLYLYEPHVSEAAFRAAFIKHHAHAKIHHNPIKFRCHNLLREENIFFVA